MLLRLATVLMLGAAALVSGCSSDPGPPADIEYHSTPLAGKADSGKKPKPEKTRKTRDTRPRKSGPVLVAPAAGIQLTLPRGWRTVDPKLLGTPEFDDAIASLLKADGIPSDQVPTTSNMDAFAASPEGTVIIQRVGTGSAFPSDEEFVANMASFVKVGSVDHVSTPVGEGRAAYYRLTAGTLNVPGCALFLLIQGQFVDVTITAFRDTDIKVLTKRLMDSLRRS